mmetsp:Transcript_24270/g.41532  ORF Transcript_24270/g.41532 Transcript_24270/m.41532 type:complete len:89 (+) Transcript_24270:461-727(+)
MVRSKVKWRPFRTQNQQQQAALYLKITETYQKTSKYLTIASHIHSTNHLKLEWPGQSLLGQGSRNVWGESVGEVETSHNEPMMQMQCV